MGSHLDLRAGSELQAAPRSAGHEELSAGNPDKKVRHPISRTLEGTPIWRTTHVDYIPFQEATRLNGII